MEAQRPVGEVSRSTSYSVGVDFDAASGEFFPSAFGEVGGKVARRVAQVACGAGRAGSGKRADLGEDAGWEAC